MKPQNKSAIVHIVQIYSLLIQRNNPNFVGMPRKIVRNHNRPETHVGGASLRFKEQLCHQTKFAKKGALF